MSYDHWKTTEPEIYEEKPLNPKEANMGNIESINEPPINEPPKPKPAEPAKREPHESDVPHPDNSDEHRRPKSPPPRHR